MIIAREANPFNPVYADLRRSDFLVMNNKCAILRNQGIHEIWFR